MVNIMHLLFSTRVKLGIGYTSWQQQGGPVECALGAPWMEQLLNAVGGESTCPSLRTAKTLFPPLSHCLHCVQRETWDKAALPDQLVWSPPISCQNVAVQAGQSLKANWCHHRVRKDLHKWPRGTDSLQSTEKVQHSMALLTKSKIVVSPVQSFS